MKKIGLVFIGGSIGSLLRYLTTDIFKSLELMNFPIATCVVNIIGCFIMGLLIAKNSLNKNVQLLLATGFCGGFTTFSTFSFESLILLENGQTVLAITYIMLSIILGTFVTFIGYNTALKKSN